MGKTTTIPITGSRDYVLAFKAYALKKNKTMGDLVRAAMDAAYGDVTQETAVFFADSGQSIIHSDDNISTSTDSSV